MMRSAVLAGLVGVSVADEPDPVARRRFDERNTSLCVSPASSSLNWQAFVGSLIELALGAA